MPNFERPPQATPEQKDDHLRQRMDVLKSKEKLTDPEQRELDQLQRHFDRVDQ